MSEIYPIWWDTTVTIYNKFIDSVTQVVTWHKYVVPNCFWKYNNNSKVKVGDVLLNGNNIICRIPEDVHFKERYEWELLPNYLKDEYYTLSQGDIIIKGEVEDVINEYEQGQRSSDLKQKYKALQGCLEIDSFTLNTGIGRNNPHYYVAGV